MPASLDPISRSIMRNQPLRDRLSRMGVSGEALLVLCGPDGSNLALSETTRRYFGPSANQMLGCGWVSAIHPDDQMAAADAWLKAVYDEAAYDLQLSYRRHDGRYHYFAVTGVRYVDADTCQTHWLVISEPLRASLPVAGPRGLTLSAGGGGPVRR